MEVGMWEFIKGSMNWIILPLLGSIAYFFRKYVTRVEHLETRINKMEIRMAVVEANIAHMREDIQEIKNGVDKILDKL